MCVTVFIGLHTDDTERRNAAIELFALLIGAQQSNNAVSAAKPQSAAKKQLAKAKRSGKGE
jgi:hypothetical protein